MNRDVFLPSKYHIESFVFGFENNSFELILDYSTAYIVM